jgi:hypothetical protein
MAGVVGSGDFVKPRLDALDTNEYEVKCLVSYSIRFLLGGPNKHQFLPDIQSNTYAAY